MKTIQYTIMYRPFVRSRRLLKLEIRGPDNHDSSISYINYLFNGMRDHGKQPKLVAIFEES
jgi:hypothetical protein